ncbi:hypothetical protein BJ741DRAFT_612746, partial [Chytriomyces cf. hyalinus JEL632]
ELLITIAEYLAVHQLVRLTATCNRMRPLWHMTHLWIKVAIAVFGERMHAQLAKSKPSLLLSSWEKNVSAGEVMEAYEVLASVVPATHMHIAGKGDPRYWTMTNSMPGITDVGERYLSVHWMDYKDLFVQFHWMWQVFRIGRSTSERVFFRHCRVPRMMCVTRDV